MSAAVRIWEEREGLWRWAFRDGSLEILSNHPCATKREALKAAAVAYPDTPVEASPEPGPIEAEPARLPALLLGMVALWRSYHSARRP